MYTVIDTIWFLCMNWRITDFRENAYGCRGDSKQLTSVQFDQRKPSKLDFLRKFFYFHQYLAYKARPPLKLITLSLKNASYKRKHTVIFQNVTTNSTNIKQYYHCARGNHVFHVQELIVVCWVSTGEAVPFCIQENILYIWERFKYLSIDREICKTSSLAILAVTVWKLWKNIVLI